MVDVGQLFLKKLKYDILVASNVANFMNNQDEPNPAL